MRTVVTVISIATLLLGVISLAPPSSAADGVEVNFGPTAVGWSSARQCGVRGVHPDPILDSFCHADTRYEFIQGTWRAQPSPASWAMPIEDGTYAVQVTVGEAQFNPADTRHSVQANGVTIHDGVQTSTALPFVTGSAVAVVQTGELRLTFDGGFRTKIVSMSVTPVAAPTTTTTLPITTTTTTTTTLPTTTSTPPELMPPAPRLVVLPAGIIELDDPLVIESFMTVRGAGQGVTILVPGSGYTVDKGPLIQSARSEELGDHHFHIEHLTVDCRGVCEGIELYGYQFSIDHVSVIDAAGYGLHTAWSDVPWAEAPQPRPAVEAFLDNIEIQQSGSPTKPPVLFDGPHDMVVEDLFVSTHLWLEPEELRPAAVEIGPGGFGTIIDRLHFWGREHLRGVVVAPGVSGVRLTNGYFEGARLEQVLLPDSNANTIIDGRVECFPSFAPDSMGIKVVGATNSHHLVRVQTLNCPQGGLVFEADAGAASFFDVSTWQSPIVGIPHATAIVNVASVFGSRLEPAVSD